MTIGVVMKVEQTANEHPTRHLLLKQEREGLHLLYEELIQGTLHAPQDEKDSLWGVLVNGERPYMHYRCAILP